MDDSPQRNDSVAPIPPVSDGVHLRGWALVGVLAGLILTLLLAALDQTIVGTALPHIIGDLHGFDRYSWVVTAYLITASLLRLSLSTKKIASWQFFRFV